MTERLYLHVGAPKSGTTYIQGVLEANRGRFEQAGVWVGADRLDCIHAAMVVREDPRLAHLPASAAGSWERLVAQVRSWSGPAAVISYELFAGASAPQVRKALAALDGIEVHVVVTARDFGRAVPSAWQERLKFALTVPLEAWTPRPESAGPRAEWGWRTMDPAGVARRWSAAVPRERVHVVTVPRAGDRDELWRRFAEACGVADVAVTPPPGRANESLGLAATEVLRRVNERLEGPLRDNNRLQSRWLRDVFAHEVLAGLSDEPIGVTEAQLGDATERSEQAVAEIAAQGYRVHGDLADLRATAVGTRTPGEADDAELLDVALTALARLLAREAEQPDAGRGDQARPDVDAGGTPLRRAQRRIRTLAAAGRGAALERLEARVAELESELTASRALQLRVAELTDVVDHLLVEGDAAGGPTADQLSAYRAESL